MRIRRHPSVDPAVVGPYDICIVLTGLNDLKDEFLPFMMSAQHLAQLRQAQRQQEKESGGSDDDDSNGIQQALIRILHALEDKMQIRVLPPQAETMNHNKNTNGHHSGSSDNPNASESASPSSGQQQRLQTSSYVRRPLVVFPALPVATIEMNRVAPLGWFLGPIIRAMDNHKKRLAELYPGLVVFVDAPTIQVLSAVEERRGPLWDTLQQERVLLQLTDVVATVRDKVEDLMKQHYQSWFLDAGEDDDDEDSNIMTTSLYEIELDGVCLTTPLRRGELGRNHPGATMVSCDGVHPSDSGYAHFFALFLFVSLLLLLS